MKLNKQNYGVNQIECDYYIALCGLFPPSRNILKHWDTNEEVFYSFVQKEKEEGTIAIEHFL